MTEKESDLLKAESISIEDIELLERMKSLFPEAIIERIFRAPQEERSPST